MRRQEDFQEQAKKYANEYSGTTQEKCATMTDYFAGCEHGYQYAVEKACEWLRKNIEYWLCDYNLAEDELENNQVHYAAMLEELRKAMEE